MNISQRQRQLLENLNEHQEAVSAKTLSQLLGVSSKTVRNDIIQINQLFSPPIISSKAGKGYFLVYKNQVFQTVMENKVDENLPYEILQQIIGQNELNLYELAEKFYVSESTLLRIVQELNTVIAKKNPALCIIRRQNKLLIEGEEEEKRQIFNLFLNQEIENYNLSLDKYTDYFDYCDLNKMSTIIISYHKTKQYKMNDFSTISFILHIAVLIERISMGSYIQQVSSNEYDDVSMVMAKELANQLEAHLQVSIPIQELSYIARLYSRKRIKKATADNQVIYQLVNELLQSVYQNFHIDFSADKKMRDYLLTHLTALYQRAEQQQYLTNPLTEELKNKFPFIYNVSVYAAAFVQNKLDISFPDDEIAYIALHFLSASETINHGKRRKILLICPYGAGNQRFVSNQLQKNSNFSVDVRIAQSIFDIDQFLADKEIDLIVTTETIKQATDIPVYRYNLLLEETDLRQIKKLLESSKEMASISQKFFKKELFFPKQTFKTKEEVITFLCHHLETLDYCDSDYVDKVLEREELSSTSYGNYYAIPHAIQRSAKKNAVAVCSLDKPIDWGGKKVRLILLLAMKEERDNSFELLFGQLVKILNEASFVNKLAKPEDFLKFVQLCEQ